MGSPTRGDWRLELTSELDIAVTSYIRTEDGFLTSMHDLAPPGAAAQAARVPIFNPGSNRRQVSLLRVVNDGDAAATVRVTGVDDAGMPSGEVLLTVRAGETRTLEAADLEAGDAAFEGALGDGVGKWRLAVASDVPVSVMSLLRSPRRASDQPLHRREAVAAKPTLLLPGRRRPAALRLGADRRLLPQRCPPATAAGGPVASPPGGTGVLSWLATAVGDKRARGH